MRVTLSLDKTAPPPEPVRVRRADSLRPVVTATVLDGTDEYDMTGAAVTFRCGGEEVECAVSGATATFAPPAPDRTSPGHLRVETAEAVVTTQDLLVEVV